MFYFDEINNEKVLKSDFITAALAFFTLKTTNEEKLLSSIFYKRVIRPEQTHSSNIQIVSENNEYKNTDGLILTNKDDIVCLKFADCTPLIFYDEKQNIGAVSHAGWRGTAEKIGVKTVEKMVKEFNSDKKNIVVLIGPAISKCCYEVSDDVKNTLLETVNDKNDLYKKNNVDLKNINARQLYEIGIEKIDICPYCTSCNNNLFYSYRKENGTLNRHKAMLKLL